MRTWEELNKFYNYIDRHDKWDDLDNCYVEFRNVNGLHENPIYELSMCYIKRFGIYDYRLLLTECHSRFHEFADQCQTDEQLETMVICSMQILMNACNEDSCDVDSEDSYDDEHDVRPEDGACSEDDQYPLRNDECPSEDADNELSDEMNVIHDENDDDEDDDHEKRRMMYILAMFGLLIGLLFAAYVNIIQMSNTQRIQHVFYNDALYGIDY